MKLQRKAGLQWMRSGGERHAEGRAVCGLQKAACLPADTEALLSNKLLMCLLWLVCCMCIHIGLLAVTM